MTQPKTDLAYLRNEKAKAEQKLRSCQNREKILERRMSELNRRERVHRLCTRAGIKLRAKVVGGDAPSKAFLAATNRVGLAFNYDSLQLSDYRISCVGTALKLYNEMGEKIYCESLRLIVAAWNGKPDSFRASVLRGMMHFVELYHGEFSEERLVRALGSVHPMEIYRVGRDNPAKLPGWKKYVFPIYMAYNGKGRKDALPMKF